MSLRRISLLLVVALAACGKVDDTGAGGDTVAIGFKSGIAYAKDGDIYIADQRDFENKTQRLTTDGSNGSPALSRNGKVVAYVHTDAVSSTQTLFSVPTAGGAPSTLINVAGRTYAGLAWSADAGKLFFSASSGGQASGIFQVNADGSGEAAVSPPAGTFMFPSVAGDGSLWALGGSTFVKIDPAAHTGTNGFSASGSITPGYGAISPDGTRIALEDTTSHEIFVVSALAGSQPTQLTQADGAQKTHPTWSTDGSKIAFSSNAGGGEKIYLSNANAVQGAPSATLIQVGDQPSYGG